MSNQSTMIADQVWLITGCSTGFGRSLALKALSKGYKVLVTARQLSTVQDICDQYPESCRSFEVDLEKADGFHAFMQSAQNAFGRIDVLVNNAGIGYFSSAEEADMSIARKMFEINFFGLTQLCSLVLPIMRQQRKGHIINISSIAGLMGFPAVSFYNATKFAVAGYSESLAKEVAGLGIHVSIVCPSGFRTDWAGRSAFETPVAIEDYASTAGANIEAIRSRSGKQPGDPEKAAEAIIMAYEANQPPLYLMLGNGAMVNGRAKVDLLTKDFEAWADISLGADVPASQ